MGTGYVRQSAADIVTGAVVEAAPLNLEFNQLRDAFHETSGHSHDGTTGEGPKIGLTTSVSGVLPVANGGFAAIHKINGTLAPTINEDSDDGYGVGSIWLDTTNDRAYICVDSTVGAAVWLLIGTVTGFQPLDTDLTAIAALTSAADKMLYATGAGTWALADLSSYARTLLDDANAAATLTTLGITSSVAELNYTDGVTSAIQTQIDGKQAADADLTALAALTGTNTIYYRSAADTWSPVTIGGNLTFAAGTLDAVASSLDATLTSIAALGSAADKGIYFTGIDTAAEFTLTSFARSLVDDADAATARATLGLTIGTNVQAYDAELAAIAGLTSAADKVPYFTGSGTAALADLTAPGRTLIALTDPNADRVLIWDDSASSYVQATLGAGLEISGTTIRAIESFVIAVSDETTAITTGTAKVTFRMPYAFTLTAVRASLTTVSSSGNPAIDINEGGVSIFSTTLTIDANEKTSTTATTAAVISDTSLADDAEMTIDIDTAGTGAKGLKVTLIGYRA